MGIQWKGMDKLQAALQEKMKLEAAKQIVRINGAELQQKAMRKSPVDTGTLKRSITLDVIDKGYTVRIAPSVHYAAYVEYGTRFMDAQPYLRPAFNEQKAVMEADLKKLTR